MSLPSPELVWKHTNRANTVAAVSDGMAAAAAEELARFAAGRALRDESILPRKDEWDVVPRIAFATAREATEAPMRCGVIAERPQAT